jgi:hypothetical protein
LYYYFSLPIPFFSNIINNKETWAKYTKK